MTHTPAPWTAVAAKNADDTLTGYWHIQAGKVAIADVFGIAGYDEETGEMYLTEKEIASDARIMAAAPELLAACKSAAKWLDTFAAHAPITFGGEETVADILRAAIAKAEGK